MKRTLFLLSVLVGLAPALPVQAEEVFPVAHGVRGEPFRGKLTGIDPEWNISLAAGGKERVLALGDLAFWGGYQDASAGPQLLLADGSQIVADVLEFGTERVTLGDASGLARIIWNESTIPLRQLLAILYQPSADPLQRDKQLEKLRSPERKEDQVWLTSGEVISGRLVSLPRYGRFTPPAPPPQAEVLRLSRRGSAEPLVIPLAKVIAVSLSSIQSPAVKSRPAAWLGMKDRSLLAAKRVTAEREVITVELLGGGLLKAFRETGDEAAPAFWDQVSLIQTSSANVAYLSELSPDYKHISFTALAWPLGTDRNVLGGRLRSGERTILRGLGMHSASRAAFELAGGEQRFEAELALDDRAGSGGSIVGKVLLEASPGKWMSAYESPVLRGGDAPVAVSVPLKGARRLALLIEFADHGDERDYANWLNARVVK